MSRNGCDFKKHREIVSKSKPCMPEAAVRRGGSCGSFLLLLDCHNAKQVAFAQACSRKSVLDRGRRRLCYLPLCCCLQTFQSLMNIEHVPASPRAAEQPHGGFAQQKAVAAADGTGGSGGGLCRSRSADLEQLEGGPLVHCLLMCVWGSLLLPLVR